MNFILGCAHDQFRCRNGDCVSGSAHCNGHRECSDNSDEEDCSDPAMPQQRCHSSQFRCDNGQCISAYAHCDGYVDCADSSDERYCRKFSYNFKELTKNIHFTCISFIFCKNRIFLLKKYIFL